jgi:LysM repeat protein
MSLAPDHRYGSGSLDEPPSERLIPFPTRGVREPDATSYGTTPRRRQLRGGERPARRRARRRHQTPWLQRNAISVAAISVLIALLGVGFGLAQVVNRPGSAQALPAAEVASDAQSPTMGAMSITGAAPAAEPADAALESQGPRQIQASARVLEPTYTVEAGDTLGRIAARFNTTPERIQAINNLADPRTLRIGARLIIPEPL